jgi:hypothetical protein
MFEAETSSHVKRGSAAVTERVREVETVVRPDNLRAYFEAGTMITDSQHRLVPELEKVADRHRNNLAFQRYRNEYIIRGTKYQQDKIWWKGKIQSSKATLY